MVCKTVLLELEWVLRGYYEFHASEICKVFRHVLSMPHVLVEDRQAIEHAVANAEAGLDFADALHHASYRQCESMASFDDRKFARRTEKLGMTPVVIIPA